MPRYSYKCKECEHVFDVDHGMLIKLKNCDECDTEDSLFRIPSSTYSTKNKQQSEEKTGELVKEFIRSTKKDIGEDKKSFKEEIY